MWFNFRAASSVLFSFVRWRIVMVRGGERLVLGTQHLDVKERQLNKY